MAIFGPSTPATVPFGSRTPIGTPNGMVNPAQAPLAGSQPSNPIWGNINQAQSNSNPVLPTSSPITNINTVPGTQNLSTTTGSLGNTAPTAATAPLAGQPAGSTTPAAPSGTPGLPAGVRDMSGQTWGVNQTPIPQGWGMDANGNWVNWGGASATGIPANGSSGVGAGYAPASTVTTSFNPAETAANLQAGGWVQNPDGSWSNTTGMYNQNPNSSDYQTYHPIQGQAQAPLAGQPAPQMTPAATNTGTNALLSYLQSLFGNQQAPQAQATPITTTPLGYTQYAPQQAQAPASTSDQSLQLLMQMLFANQTPQNTGFWNFGQ